MSLRRIWIAGGMVAALGAAALGQGPIQRIPEPLGTPFANKFVEAWMTETLLGDLAKARKLYRQAVTEADLPDQQVELSLLRLWESSFDADERRRHATELRKRSVFQSGGYRSRRLSEINTKMQKALAEKDAATVAKLRKEVREFLKQNPTYRTTRSIVPEELRTRRGEQAVDQKLEDLKAERKKALDRGDGKKARELARSIWRHQGARSTRGSQARLWARRWAEMTRLHLEGKHERAAGMERMLRTQLYRFRGPNQDPKALIGRIQRLDPSALHKEFDQLSEEVQRQSRSERRWPEEREVLTLLHQRIVELGKAGRVLEAMILTARTPYRTTLFRPR